MITDLHVLVPDELGGVSIVPAADLVSRLDAGETPEEAITNAGVDYLGTLSGDGLAREVERVRQLNLTGDTTAFWSNPDA